MFKKLNLHPPGGWQYYEQKTRWTAPKGLTFETLVRKVMEHRIANPQYQLPTDYQSVSDEVQIQNGRRINFLPQFWEGEAPKKKEVTSLSASLPQKRQLSANRTESRPKSAIAHFVTKIRSSAAGAATLADWVGDKGIPVPEPLANARAKICAQCPKNQKGDWMDKVTAKVAEAIKTGLEIKNGMSLKVQNESELGTCEACGCHLPLKVWAPLSHIKDSMTEEVAGQLAEDCWVRKEPNQQLILVIPYCNKDLKLAMELIEWIFELDGKRNGTVILVADIKVPAPARSHMARLAAQAFEKVDAITTPFSLPNERWPIGPNWIFETTLRHIYSNYQQPFYFCEPDCIPLKKGWLEKLQSEYNLNGKPFMGAVVSSSGQPNLPSDHLTGCAVYPWNAHEYLESTYGKPVAFDMLSAPFVLEHTHATKLHHHFWGQTTLPPVFRKNRSEDNPQNTLLLGRIPAEAVVHHRNKDGSLIRLLRAHTTK
jgi:hypothetical protein